MRKNRKYTAEFKIEIVKKAIEDNISINELARQNEMTKKNIQRWIRDYHEHGEEYFYKEHRGNGGGNPYAALHTSKNLSEKEKRIEWTYILDTYNNEIIASSLSKREGDPKPYHECIKTLIEKTKEQRAPVTLHTDQGAIYSSQAFYNAHSHYTYIDRSMSRVGTPTDNPIIEAINGWIKEELYKDFNLYYCDDVEKLISDYVDYYNTERPSTKCGRKSPVQF